MANVRIIQFVSNFVLKGVPTFHYLNFKSTRQHLVGLIEAENLDFVRHQSLQPDQVEQPAGRAHNDMNTFCQCLNIFSHLSPSDAGMTFYIHIFSDFKHHFLRLLCQFSSWREYKCLGRVDRCVQLEGGKRG